MPVIKSSSGGGTPGGADTQVQFNDGGAFGGDAGLTYNKTTDKLDLTGNVEITKADPEIRLTDSGDSDYARLTRSDTTKLAVQYNRVNKPGGAGSAASFNGSSSVLNCGTDASLDITGTLSIEMWAYPTSQNLAALIDHAQEGASVENYAILISSGTSSPKFYFQWHNGTAFDSVQIDNFYTLNTWQHVVLVYDNGNVTIYKDGSVAGSATGKSALVATAANTMKLGRYQVGSQGWYTGRLDEVRVYNKALTSTEVTTHYNAGAGQYGSDEANLQAGYHLDEASGNATDYSGNGNTGVNTSVTYVTGKVSAGDTVVEAQVWASQNGLSANEEGVHTFGDAQGGSIIHGQTVKLKTNDTERVRIQNSGGMSIGSSVLSTDPGEGGLVTAGAIKIGTENVFRGASAYKTADESITSSTTLQDDDHLSVSLAASAIYWFKMWIFTNNAGALEGFKCALGGTAGVTSLKGQIRIYDDTTNSTAADARVTALGSAVGAGLGAGDNWSTIEGTIETSTAGTFLLQWAQNASGASATTVQRNSFLAAVRIA